MSAQLAAVFARRAGSSDRQSVRVVRQNDERRILQACEGSVVTQFDLSGRPDGLRPGGCETYLDYLQARPQRAAGLPAYAPQEWMELDREFTQFALRRRAALLAAAEAQGRNDSTTSLQMYRLAAKDAQHGQDIIAFAVRAHPLGRMSATRPEARPSLVAQQCTAEAALCVLTDDFAGATACVRAGVQQIASLLRAAGDKDPGSHVCIRDLEELDAAVRSAGQVVQDTPLGITVPQSASRSA